MRIDRNFDGIRPNPPKDPRDFRLRNYIPPDVKLTIDDIQWMDWLFPQPALDQLGTPHCGGFGTADFLINKPTFTPCTNEDGHNFYYLCKELEGEPLKENGIYVRTVAKLLLNLHKLEAYAFTSSTEEIAWWILHKGPVMIGTAWYSGMDTPDANNIIHATGVMEGGHFWLANEVRQDKLIGCQNSWGAHWGINGKAYISLDDLQKIIGVYGEAITAVELADEVEPTPEEPPVEPPVEPVPEEPPVTPPESNPGCLSVLWSLFKNGRKG
jgi:hypothetical protein